MEKEQNVVESHRDVTELFESQQNIMSEVYKKGFRGYVEELPNLYESFIEHDHCVRCIDEGTPGGFHSAGSGILREKIEVIEAFKKAGVKEITSHDGCGAAGIYAKVHNLDSSKSDEYGKVWAKEIAGELGVSYRHITAKEMNRPEGRHVARVAYYDATGKFDYSKVSELPTGFIISRAIQRLNDSVAESEVSFNIATGDHGFGVLITKHNPFVIVVIARDEEELSELKSELSGLSDKFGERLRIDGFVAPKKKNF